MDRSAWRPTHLTPTQLEERRLAAAALLRQGRLTRAAIARRAFRRLQHQPAMRVSFFRHAALSVP
jgi:hypothetical protein